MLSRSRGVFAGISLQGATLRQDLDDNAVLYGKKLENREIVTKGVGRCDRNDERSEAAAVALQSWRCHDRHETAPHFQSGDPPNSKKAAVLVLRGHHIATSRGLPTPTVIVAPVASNPIVRRSVFRADAPNGTLIDSAGTFTAFPRARTWVPVFQAPSFWFDSVGLLAPRSLCE
jgi:Las17-binding protein actin regulator